MKTLNSNLLATLLKLAQNNYFKTISFKFRTESIRKLLLNFLIVTVIAASLNSCATIFGGQHYVFQKNKPLGEPDRKLKVGALIPDILFPPFLIIDFADGAIYEPVNPNNKVKNSKSVNSELCDSISKRYYLSGELLCETPYKNGKINGIQTLYYKNGKIISETPFTYGLANGVCTTYSKDGKWMQELTYVNGNINGVVVDRRNNNGAKGFTNSGQYKFVNNKAYFRDGRLSYEIPSSNGIINGLVKKYNLWSEYDKSEPYYFQEFPYINNIINGIANWRSDEEIYSQSEYVDGIKVSSGNNNSEVAGALVGALQQGLAYYDMNKNFNTQTVNTYAQIAINNAISNSPMETLKKNNDILANSINNPVNSSQATPESSASTNGGSFIHNAGAAKNCSNSTQDQWKNTVEYNNYLRNPDCNKMAYISQRKLAELILQNCSQFLPPAEIDGFRKTIASLTATINGMQDCKTYNFK